MDTLTLTCAAANQPLLTAHVSRDWLEATRAAVPTPWRTDAADVARSLERLAWAEALGSALHGRALQRAAARLGRLDVLERLRARYVEWDDGLLGAAAAADQLEVVEWVFARGHGRTAALWRGGPRVRAWAERHALSVDWADPKRDFRPLARAAVRVAPPTGIGADRRITSTEPVVSWCCTFDCQHVRDGWYILSVPSGRGWSFVNPLGQIYHAFAVCDFEASGGTIHWVDTGDDSRWRFEPRRMWCMAASTPYFEVNLWLRADSAAAPRVRIVLVSAILWLTREFRSTEDDAFRYAQGGMRRVDRCKPPHARLARTDGRDEPPDPDSFDWPYH
jgi:hypothetical protein